MFQFEPEKALEAILYVSSKVRDRDMYLSLKTLYVADKKSLSRYGRFIAGDWYAAMRDGPVGSNAYNIVKYVRGDEQFSAAPQAVEAFRLDNHSIIGLRGPDLNWLSESDIECLDDAILEMGGLAFNHAKDVSHDAAWKSTGANARISETAIAETLENGPAVVEHLNNLSPPN